MKQLNTLFRFFPILLALAFAAPAGAQSEQYLHFDRVDDYVQTPNADQLPAAFRGGFLASAVAMAEISGRMKKASSAG